MERKEFKYLINESTARSIAAAISPYVVYDPYALNHSNRSYPVYSLYFDTPKKQFFYEKLDGILNRVKIRIRTYSNKRSDHQPIFLEYKRKVGETIIKDREEISTTEYQKLVSGNAYGLFSQKVSLFKKGSVHAATFGLTPIVNIIFDREAFFDRTGGYIRINFDRNIKAKTVIDLFDSSPCKSIMEKHLVMEIKFTKTIPHWLHKVITGFDLQREPFSKYFHSLTTCSIVDELNFLRFS